MPPRPERAPSPSGYFLKFGLTAGALAAITLLLVLVVLPRRYVLHAGLRESGASFPTGAVPFTPPAELRLEARPLPPPPVETLKGPAELFWGRVDPLLLQGADLAASLPIFQDYLERYPEDTSVLREYAVTLGRLGRQAEAVPVWREILARQDSPGERLLLARTLRDLGRLQEASTEYARLADGRPDDADLLLEWGKALAWGKEYGQAEALLEEARRLDPDSRDVATELARAYYASGKLHEAARVLDQLAAMEPLEGEIAELRDGVQTALQPVEAPVEEPPPAPTLLEQAARAAAEEDFDAAAGFYRQALQVSPNDTAAWRGYADLLQYHLQDLDQAREALLSLDALGTDDPGFQLRLAQVEVWTGHTTEAQGRLLALLRTLPPEAPAPLRSDSTAFGPPQVAEVRALLGDLARWEGDRVHAADAYFLALESDSTSSRAQQGLDELVAEETKQIASEELPGLRGVVYSLGDSDEFLRLDVGAEGIATRGEWVLGVRGGTRWLEGMDLFGASRREQGSYLEAEGARWWKWGTLRTGLKLGVEEVRPNRVDLSAAASIRWPSLAGFRADLRYEHGPAYPLTSTLQSVYAKVMMDRLSGALARQLSERWNLTVAADATLVRTGRGPFAPDGDRTLRAEAGLSLGRSISESLVVGFNARALTYDSGSPRSGDLRLFWDPRGLVSGGIFAQLDHELTPGWRIRGLLNPSMAVLDERSRPGWREIPHFSGETGLSYRGSLFQTSLDGFYYQGRFDGYQAYGVRLTISATPWGSGGRNP